MNDNQLTPSAWFAGVLALAAAGFIGYTLPKASTETTVTAAPASSPAPAKVTPVAAKPQAKASSSYAPPPESEIPKGPFGDMVRLGEAIFHDTQNNAKEFVGNDLQCSNCHIDRGRQPHSAPLGAAYLLYPAYRAKNGHVNSFQERLQGCFRFSMNGKAPAFNDKVLVALETYAYFLAKGGPTGVAVEGHGYPKLKPPEKPADYDRGAQVYAQHCAVCHGGNGEGQKSADGQTVFPALWGARSFNWGAGMGSINNAAGFIKANMPLGLGGTLSDQDAWDVATYMDSQERPQDPRFNGSVAETRKKYHDEPTSKYGIVVNGVLLGEKSTPSGTINAANPDDK
ncbi:c-type cytochrome [[Pseudomonas] carboxydohydrogena]|uniref:C-type cytochrome n=1 Tax=Afipia carboxydohydrogena TaxID=290 RepID=A0ABY8BK54_AFICR|nr:c-type cytochrome [[Pseudomonas] carboxydohydrogena]WEF50323.1 c-type cytochrome [[Pseudomonas] carboxydohydrogena]